MRAQAYAPVNYMKKPKVDPKTLRKERAGFLDVLGMNVNVGFSKIGKVTCQELRKITAEAQEVGLLDVEGADDRSFGRTTAMSEKAWIESSGIHSNEMHSNDTRSNHVHANEMYADEVYVDNIYSNDMHSSGMADAAGGLRAFRVELENQLRNLGTRSGLNSDAGDMSQLLRALTRNGAIMKTECVVLKKLITILDRAARGSAVEADASDWLAQTSPRFLYALEVFQNRYQPPWKAPWASVG